MIYLSNCPGKNEFKITWMIPLIVFPLFAVAGYIFYHLNIGGARLKKRLRKSKDATLGYIESIENVQKLLENYPEVKDIGNYLYASGNYAPSLNNSVEYFPTGEEFYKDLMQEIKQAQKYIFLEFFIVGVEESWATLVDLLEQKSKEGVEIRLVYDGIGSIMASTRRYVKYLKTRGINAQIFCPVVPFFSTQLNNRNHRKIVVIDGKTAYTGGLNMSNEYFNMGKNRFTYWKDNAVKLKGEAIKNLTVMFLQDWSCCLKNAEDPVVFKNYFLSAYSKNQDKGLVITYGDDAFNKEDIAENVYLYILEKAVSYVNITSPYLVLDNHLLEQIVFTAKKGIQVNIIIPSVPDHLVTFCVGKTFMKDLMDAGVNVYVYKKGFIHAKTFISDGKIATVGSINLDYRSFYHHFECGCFMYDVPVIQDIQQDFDETLKDCELMTPQLYKKIPLIQRIIGRIFRIFSPLI